MAAIVLSVVAWVAILWMRHKITPWRAGLIVIVSQVIWSAVIAAVWGVFAGIGYALSA